MKFQMLGRTASQAFQFEIIDAGPADVLPALYIQNRQQLFLKVDVLPDLSAVNLINQFRAGARLNLVTDIYCARLTGSLSVLCASTITSKRVRSPVCELSGW